MLTILSAKCSSPALKQNIGNNGTAPCINAQSTGSTTMDTISCSPAFLISFVFFWLLGMFPILEHFHCAATPAKP
jgi:hypothetical protein